MLFELGTECALIGGWINILIVFYQRLGLLGRRFGFLRQWFRWWMNENTLLYSYTPSTQLVIVKFLFAFTCPYLFNLLLIAKCYKVHQIFLGFSAQKDSVVLRSSYKMWYHLWNRTRSKMWALYRFLTVEFSAFSWKK